MGRKVTDEEFVSAWNRAVELVRDRGSGSVALLVSEMTGINERSVHRRRTNLEVKGYRLPRTPHQTGGPKNDARNRLLDAAVRYAMRLDIELRDGVVLVASDCHYWPGEATPAHRALVRLTEELEPRLVVLNGDILDGARISRHPPLGWPEDPPPRLYEEIATVQERLTELEAAAPNAELVRTAGNHDIRYEKWLATHAPEFEGLRGMSLSDHIPRWKPCFALHINAESPGHTVIRHRPVSGGIHSGYNSVLRSGVNYVHGHLHRLLVTPWGDYRDGRRYGVDTGTLADPVGPQFQYLEGGPTAWASGFAVLTFRDGRLLPPELVEVHGEAANFRGRDVLEERPAKRRRAG